MGKRSGKFYSKNEKEVMESLGLKPTKASGSGWLEKEDGQNESIICQLKSTDANSIKINKFDLDKLEYNANVENKIPVFAIQFLKTNELFLLVKDTNLKDVTDALELNRINRKVSLIVNPIDEEIRAESPKIKSGNKVKYWKEREEEWTKQKK